MYLFKVPFTPAYTHLLTKIMILVLGNIMVIDICIRGSRIFLTGGPQILLSVYTHGLDPLSKVAAPFEGGGGRGPTFERGCKP